MHRLRLSILLTTFLFAPGCGEDDRGLMNWPSSTAGMDGTHTGTGDDAGTSGSPSGSDDGMATSGSSSADADTGGDATVGGSETGEPGETADTGVPPGECPPSGMPAPQGCWGMNPGDWDNVSCGCGPALYETGGPANLPSLEGCSYFDHAGQLLDEINNTRDMYVDSGNTLCHSRYKGIPWEGENAGMTWPSYFMWDDCLAAKAQALAEQIAAGQATHQGVRVDGQNGCCEDFYMDNLFEGDFRITFDEYPGQYADKSWALARGNGSARMGLYYQDFGGDGPVLQMLGVGAAVGPNCRVTWVLQFGE